MGLPIDFLAAFLVDGLSDPEEVILSSPSLLLFYSPAHSAGLKLELLCPNQPFMAIAAPGLARGAFEVFPALGYNDGGAVL
jgi:hypothetical protein